MMERSKTDDLLSEWFKENAPYVNEAALRGRVAARGPRRRRIHRRARNVRIAAAACATVILVLAVAFGAYSLVDHFRGRSTVFITDSTLPASESPTSTAEIQARVALMTSASVVLEAGDRTWTLSPGQIAAYLETIPGPGTGSSFTGPCLSAQRMNALFAQIAPELETDAVDASFAADGDKVWVVPGANGRAVDAEETAGALTAAALRASDRTAEVVFRPKEPGLTTAEAEAMGITERLASYSTMYEGGVDRQVNVKTATRYAGDALLAPGEEYDFNERVGPRTAARGFKATLGIVAPGTALDLISAALTQASTTLFNAALEAGLTITERHNTSIYISHYPTGRDATVTAADKNLRFVNDTGHHLWIVGASDGVATRFSIYGTDDGRRVQIQVGEFYNIVPKTTVTIPDPSLPEDETRTQSAGQAGRSLETRRTVTLPDGTIIHDDVFISLWPMYPEKIAVGTGTTGENR